MRTKKLETAINFSILKSKKNEFENINMMSELLNGNRKERRLATKKLKQLKELK
jgi:hypothetical protein